MATLLSMSDCPDISGLQELLWAWEYTRFATACTLEGDSARCKQHGFRYTNAF